MSSDLMRSQNSSALDPKAAKLIRREVQEAALKVDGAIALAAHTMGGVRDLDAHRVSLAGGNKQLDAIMIGIEVTALDQITKIQRNLFNDMVI